MNALLVAVASGAGTGASAQTGQWNWMGGNKTVDQSAVYGRLGTPAATNLPGARWGSATWTDRSGNLWLFGGGYTLADGDYADFNDLWKFNPGTLEWVWVAGSNQPDQPGKYGTLGTGATAFIPSARDNGNDWVDASGDVWIFGGAGYDSHGTVGFLNDLWKYEPATGKWTWISGSNTIPCSHYCGVAGAYGEKGSASAQNTPGSRYEASNWTDASGNFWLFGGYGLDSAGTWGYLNDLWEFNPTTHEWAWIAGEKTTPNYYTVGGNPGEYGNPGDASSENAPGSRYQASAWADSSGNFWMFGGKGYDSAGTLGYMNDLWEFIPGLTEWAWQGGAKKVPGKDEGIAGVYGQLGSSTSSNAPGSRVTARGWPDDKGNLWLFGGWGFDTNGSSGELNDLWVLATSDKKWTWVDGSKTLGSHCVTTSGVPDCGQKGVYGTMGEFASGNAPGGRRDADMWIDHNGNLWLLGGYGFDSAGSLGNLSDLWIYDLSTPTITAAMPAFTPSAGKFTGTQKVKLASGTPGAVIYYTIDKSEPSSSSTLYTGSITITKTTTVKAIATEKGYLNSPIATAVFTILKPQKISWSTIKPQIVGTKLTLGATASSGLPVTYTSLTSKICTVSSGKASFIAAGTCEIRASQAGNSVYAPAPNFKQSFAVTAK